MQVLKIIFILLEVLLLFNLLIFVHELGHFLAAKWRKLKVERFAIWFGKPIWKTRRDGVEYALGWIPAGGYVSLPQMASMETIEGKTETPAESLPPVSALDKIIVAFAGPLFSFLLAIVFAIIVSRVGRPVTEAETSTVVGHVEKDSPAEKAGLRVGDCILAVDGKKVTKFSGMGSSIMWRVVRSEGATVPVRFERDGQTMSVEVAPVIDKTKPWERKSLRRIGIEAAATPIIGAIATNSPAQRANLRRGDEILEVDGQPLVHPSQLGAFIDSHRDASLKLTVHREGKTLQVSVKPEIPVDADDGKPRLGILWDDSGGRMTLSHPAVFQQITDSVEALVSTIGALISPKSDIKPQHLSGPAKIVNIYYILFQSDQGWRLALWFSVLLNVNLALLNMLPIPVLDGGHIVLATIEGLRRKPANPRIVGWVQTACAVLLIGYMLYVTFFDLQDSRWRLKEKPSIDMKFTPKQGTPAAPNAPAPPK